MQQQCTTIIPCPSEKIEITGYKINKADGSALWTAFGCDGKTYKCIRSDEDHQNVSYQWMDPDLI